MQSLHDGIPVHQDPSHRSNDNTTDVRPPLDSLVKNDTILGNVDFLLDFAVIGFAKTGSTTMKNWLCNNHSESRCLAGEARSLFWNAPSKMVQQLYNDIPQGDFKRGYKCPNDIGRVNTLTYFQRYWPNTKIFIGIRHPVRWFESFWNFRMNNSRGHYPEPETLIGSCNDNPTKVCTDRALFHVELSRLGKTNMSAPEEVEMKRRYPQYYEEMPPPVPNKVFLFATEQLSDSNTTRSQRLKRDVMKFVGFNEELQPVGHIIPGKKYVNDTKTQDFVNSRRMDICDPRYDKLRAELMAAARPASVWIRKYFLTSKDVVVSSPDYFIQILETWMHDPCENVSRAVREE